MMNKRFRVVIVLLIVLAMSFSLAGCGKKEAATPWEWAQGLEDGDIESVLFWCSGEYGEQDDDDKEPVDKEFELDANQIDRLLASLLSLEESDFSEISGENESALYGIRITMANGKEYDIRQSAKDDGTLQMTYADKEWLIDNMALTAYFESLLNEEGMNDDDYKYASDANLVVSGSDLTDSDYGFVTYSDLVS